MAQHPFRPNIGKKVSNVLISPHILSSSTFVSAGTKLSTPRHHCKLIDPIDPNVPYLPLLARIYICLLRHSLLRRHQICLTANKIRFLGIYSPSRHIVTCYATNSPTEPYSPVQQTNSLFTANKFASYGTYPSHKANNHLLWHKLPFHKTYMHSTICTRPRWHTFAFHDKHICPLQHITASYETYPPPIAHIDFHGLYSPSMTNICVS